MKEKPSGVEIMTKTMPQLLDDVIAWSDKAEQAAKDAGEAAQAAVTAAIEKLTADELEPMKQASKLAQETADAAALAAQSAREKTAAVLKAHNDLVDKYNGLLKQVNAQDKDIAGLGDRITDLIKAQDVVNKDWEERFAKLEDMVKENMVTSIEADSQKIQFKARAYRKFGITTKAVPT